MKENLQNKVCLITGATNGIGEEAAKQIALMGAEIIFIARNQTKANQLNETIKSLTGRESTPIIADLSSQSEVKKAAEEFLSLNKPLHILLNNAGIMNTISAPIKAICFAASSPIPFVAPVIKQTLFCRFSFIVYLPLVTPSIRLE